MKLMIVVILLQVFIMLGIHFILDEIKCIKDSLKIYFEQIDYHNLQVLLKKSEENKCR